MPFSQCIQLIALLAPDRRENTFSRLSLINFLFEFVEFLKRNPIEPTHYRLYYAYWQISFLNTIKEYTYAYEYYAAGPSRVTAEDGIHRCVHCDTSGFDKTYTYCHNCGAIACDSHIKTERVEQEPVCTGCAVTERFALKTKYFYDEGNLEAFREEYTDMPIHEKAMENKLLAGASVVAALLVVIGLLVIGGVI